MNEKVIWDFLYAKTRNAHGAAALMGNLMAESSLNPLCATGKNRTQNYAMDADNGKVDFVNDGVAFGLVQWCYHTRKEGLLSYARQQGMSVGDLNTQLEYMWKELHFYLPVLNAICNATDIREASDIVMLKYEKPANTGEAARKKRAAYGQKYYDQFATKPAPAPSGKKAVTATVNVNLRAGAGKDKAIIGELKKGQTLEVIGAENGWYKVAVYVMKDFVEEV